MSRGDSDALLGEVNRKLGHFRNSVRTAWREYFTFHGRMMTIVYRTQYDGGRADETFAIRIDGDHGQLAGYHIKSTALTAK